VKAGASIGISTAPQDGCSPDEIMKTADIALYRAKAEGRGKAIFFNSAMAEALSKRQRLQSDLEQAVREGGLELNYQPILSVQDRRVVSFEALMRWRHPKLGYVSPIEFIPLAEETGLISDMGAWALKTACRAAATWPEEIAVSVNLSAAQFRAPNVDNDDAIEQIVRDALSGANLAPGRLQLEVTETLLLHDKSETWAALGKLKALGISIALDDFGTGYSSLSYLRRFPFDKIKIDKSFVSDIGEHSDSITIVQAISDLASTLGMTCVAEGVETEEQLRLIETARCEEMQGFLFSKPVPADMVLATLHACKALKAA
jgi:predicted signal transduction protein with EAL and GGDEF domain